MEATTTHLDYAALRNAAFILKSVDHPIRKRVIALLDNGKRRTVTELYEALHLDQPAMSQHLLMMRRTRTVIANRDGRHIRYALNPLWIKSIATFVNNLSDREMIKFTLNED